MKKHVNTKHVEQFCKVCNKGFKSPIEVLQHAAKEHSSNIKENTSVKEKETTLEVEEEDQTEHIDIDKFKCMRCKEIVYKLVAWSCLRTALHQLGGREGTSS